MSDSTANGPAVDAETNMEDLKGVVVLQGDDASVDVGTNFFANSWGPGGSADDPRTVVTEVTLDGNQHVQKYESMGWVQITPEQTVPVGDLTTLHMSVWRNSSTEALRILISV